MKTRYGLPGDQEVQRIIGEIDPAASFIRHNQIFAMIRYRASAEAERDLVINTY